MESVTGSMSIALLHMSANEGFFVSCIRRHTLVYYKIQ